MFDICEKVAIVDAVIHAAIIQKQHPFTVLKSSIQAFDLPMAVAEKLYSDCEQIIKNRARELPWQF